MNTLTVGVSNESFGILSSLGSDLDNIQTFY
jgi:hypothetical protein